ncbi:MAG: hypothetical protein M3O26_09835 [Pseudomonadota bacterium]|nr:hypothetical protein [Pseudomonadota bacterium]
MRDPTDGPAGGKGPDSFVPKPQFEYKAPSILAEHKYLAILFIFAIIAASVYLIRAPHKPIKIDPPPPPPVYVEPLAQH